MEVDQGCCVSYKSYGYIISKFHVIYCTDELDEICSCHLNATKIYRIHFFAVIIKTTIHNKMIGQDRQ